MSRDGEDEEFGGEMNVLVPMGSVQGADVLKDIGTGASNA
jgi:hypothetical protein